MARRRRRRMFSREQRQANRAAIEAEHDALGRAEVQRRADVALIEATSPGASGSPFRLAELRGVAEEWLPDCMQEPDRAVERQYERLTGRALTVEEAERVLEEEEDRQDAEHERRAAMEEL